MEAWLAEKIYTPYNKFHLNSSEYFQYLQASEDWIQVRVPVDSHKKNW